MCYSVDYLDPIGNLPFRGAVQGLYIPDPTQATRPRTCRMCGSYPETWARSHRWGIYLPWLLAGPFQLFFAFYSFFVLPCSRFLYVYVPSVSTCTRAAVVATPQPTAIQQQHHNNNMLQQQQVHTAVRPCRPEWDNASKHAHERASQVLPRASHVRVLCFFFPHYFFVVPSSFIV